MWEDFIKKMSFEQRVDLCVWAKEKSYTPRKTAKQGVQDFSFAHTASPFIDIYFLFTYPVQIPVISYAI